MALISNEIPKDSGKSVQPTAKAAILKRYNAKLYIKVVTDEVYNIDKVIK